MPTPSDPTDAVRRAQRLHADGRVAEAEALYREVLAADPHNPHALHLMGVLALQRGDFERAYGLIGYAVRFRPNFPQALSNLGVVLEHLNRPADAEAAYREAIRLKPDYTDAHNNLGNALRKQGKLREAAGAYRAAARLRPNDPASALGLAIAAQERGDTEGAVAHFRRWSGLQRDNPAAASDLLFALLHHPSYTPEELFAEHRRWSESFERPLRGTWFPHPNDREPARPLRVGYVSPDFREHPTARFVEPVLAHHDRAQLITVCYSDARRPDAVTERLRVLAAEWRETAGLPDEHLAAHIRRDGIDVLVDLTGHMAGNRLPVFARRPAPVQVTWLYPHSTGLEVMDWRITDDLCDPDELGTAQFHTERLLRLDGCAWCYRPTDDSPAVGPLPADRNGFVTFGSLNRLAKVSPPVARLWARVLDAVPDSRLLVLAPGGEANDSARRLFEQAGVPPARLALAAHRPRPQYLALMGEEVDIALDPFPYAGTTTTCDLLWTGVPVISLVGRTAVSRVGLDLLTAIGLPDLAADTPDTYVAAAAGLAADRPRLRGLRSTLRATMQGSPLRNESDFTRRLEVAYRRAWVVWCDSGIANK